MAAGMMRMFGGSTRTQLMVLGVILAVLGMVGAFGVMFSPNEDPASIIENPVKEKYYNAVAVWAMIGLSLVAIVGVLLIGIAYTGLPFVHMARYHVGVFYISVFSLTLLPTAITLRMGAQLSSNAVFETRFSEGLVDHGFTSPAGWFALGVGLAVMAISLLIIVMNLLALAKVSYRPSLVRSGTIMGVALVAMFIVTLMATPFLAALQFDHEVGRVGAEGFGIFQPQDITMSQSWAKWLGKAEYSSTYGTLSFWLTMMTWFVFIGLAVAIVGLIGLALYSANDRKPVVPQLILTPIGSMALAFLALLAYLFYNSQIGNLSERLSVSSDITKISYGAGNMWLALLMVVIALVLAALYAVSIREWLQALFRGQRVADPISMNSMVDPPTNLPPPPTGWPARWDRMSTMNMVVIAVAAIVFLAGAVGGYYIKRGEDQSSSFNTGQPDEFIELDKLPDEQRTIPWSDHVVEGGTQTILWQADGTWFIKEMELVVTWTDESPMPRHQNMPDVFEVAIGSTTGENESAQGQSSVSTLMGEVRIRIEFDNYILTTDLTGTELPAGAVVGAINATVTCVTAGDEEPINIGVYVRPDNGNDFTAQLIVYYKLYERT